MFELEICYQEVQKKEDKTAVKAVKKVVKKVKKKSEDGEPEEDTKEDKKTEPKKKSKKKAEEEAKAEEKAKLEEKLEEEAKDDGSDDLNMEGRKMKIDDTVLADTKSIIEDTNQDKTAVEIDNQVVFPGGKIGLLRKTLESIAEVVDHVEIKARAEGLDMQVMDSMHVVFVDIFLSKNLFDKYRCDRDITLGIKVKSLITILKDLSFPVGSSLHLSCEDDPESLAICYKSPQYVLNWELSLYSFDNEEFDLPNFDFQAEVTMYAQQFMVLPKLVGIFGEFITIEATKNMITFKQQGDTTAAAMTLQEKDDDKEVEINVLSPVRKEMAMKYIVIIGKVASLCSKIKLHMGDEAPVFFDFSLFDLGHMRYYIAPKTETDY